MVKHVLIIVSLALEIVSKDQVQNCHFNIVPSLTENMDALWSSSNGAGDIFFHSMRILGNVSTEHTMLVPLTT
jgi:hypothetical protein